MNCVVINIFIIRVLLPNRFSISSPRLSNSVFNILIPCHKRRVWQVLACNYLKQPIKLSSASCFGQFFQVGQGLTRTKILNISLLMIIQCLNRRFLLYIIVKYLSLFFLIFKMQHHFYATTLIIDHKRVCVDEKTTSEETSNIIGVLCFTLEPFPI